MKRDQQSPLTNAQIAELLAREVDEAKPPLQRALRRAGRAAFFWPIEAAELLRQERSLTELAGIGPHLAKLIQRWLAGSNRMDDVPEIRRNFLTWTEAQEILKDHADWRADLRGDLQMHTEWSDGSGSVKQMAEAAVKRGYEYIAITDHGKKLKIAGGINETELRKQWREIDEVNHEFRRQKKSFRVLRSIELNLDLAGQGDMEPAALNELEVVLGAFHLSLRKTDDQTERYLAALRNPHLNILGHPRGRIYNYRLGLRADWPRIFALAAELDKAVEIDSYPDRQDLDVELLRLARDAGVRISIGTDAHHPWQLEFIQFGLAAAIHAGIPRERILNFLSADELCEWAGSVCPQRKSRRAQNLTPV